MNKLILLGRLGKDAELQYNQDGKPRLTFTVATDYGSKANRETEWTPCVLFGETAETLSQYMTKGKQVCIEGRIRTRNWEKDGTKHYMTECMVNHVELVGSKPEGERRDTYARGGDADDLPFE